MLSSITAVQQEAVNPRRDSLRAAGLDAGFSAQRDAGGCGCYGVGFLFLAPAVLVR